MFFLMRSSEITANGRFHFLLGAFFLLGTAWAEVEPSALFSDHLVLQQGQKVPVWGAAAPGEEVTVKFAGQEKKTMANSGGEWRVLLDPLPPSGEGRLLIIQGTNTVTVSDVVVGEVWLCSGQSNMAMALAEAEGAAEERQKPDPLLRAFRVPERPGERPWRTVHGDWTRFEPGSAGRWAAFPYFFGRTLRESLGMPVGVLLCAWGGSSAVSWMSQDTLRGPEFRSLIPENVIGWGANIQPSTLYKGMLHPIAPYAVAGAAWYQGETDGEPFMNAFSYRDLFPAMIEDWRRLWRREDLPFYWVQLPNLRRKPRWPVVRESQEAALRLPRTGMITTLDIGQEAKLHPTNKHAFAQRLAGLILGREYGKSPPVEFPEFEKMQREENALRIVLRHAKGLRTKDGESPLGFEIGNAGGQFVRAGAKIEGESVLLSSPSLADPEMVRYAWSDNPKVNLVNGEGYPLRPFRTDSLPVEGEEWQWQSLPEKAHLPSRVEGGELPKAAGPDWALATEGIPADDLQKFLVLRPEPRFCQVAVSNRRRGSMTLDSPAVCWTASPAVDQGGLTAEMNAQIYRATDPFHGCDLEVDWPDPAGGFRRYRVSVLPMRVYVFQKNEIRLLASNLDNMTAPHRYRLAIRPDGVAQVYLDGEKLGLFAGEPVETDKAAIRMGKLGTAGEFTANFHQLSYGAGTFAPEEAEGEGIRGP